MSQFLPFALPACLFFGSLEFLLFLWISFSCLFCVYFTLLSIVSPFLGVPYVCLLCHVCSLSPAVLTGTGAQIDTEDLQAVQDTTTLMAGGNDAGDSRAISSKTSCRGQTGCWDLD